MPLTLTLFLLAADAAHSLGPILLALLVVFVAAKLSAELFERLGQPAVVGEILAGVLIGPQVLGWVDPAQVPVLPVLAELGVLFLLFSVGLETRPSELRRVGAPALLAAVGGVIVPFAFGYGLMLLVGVGQIPALFIGGAMVATSVGITARVLGRLGLLNAEPSRIVLGAAILDDILGLLLLAVISSFARGSVNLVQIGLTVVSSLAFVGLVLAFGGRAVGRARPVIERLQIGHALYVWAIGLCLLLAVVAGWLGVAAIIGAFLAGTALAEWSEETGLHSRVENLTEFLLPYFFVFIGIQVDLGSLSRPPVLLLCLGITLLAVLGKLLGCGLPLWNRGRALAFQVGWGMVPRGEVGIVVAQLGVSLGVLNADLFAVALFMAVATTMLAPPVVARVFRGLASEQTGGGVVKLAAAFSSELGTCHDAPCPPEVGEPARAEGQGPPVTTQAGRPEQPPVDSRIGPPSPRAPSSGGTPDR